MKLAIISTHPIQYYAPVFVRLARVPGLEIRVYYGWKGLVDGGHDREFGQAIQWDIPLLEGYDSEFVENVAADPGTHHFKGIDLPSLNDRISAWNADALLVYGWSWKAHLKALRHFHGKIPIYFRGDSTLLDERPGMKRWLRRALLRWVYGHVDVAFHVGTRNHSYYNAMGLGDRQLVFAPHAIDNERFSDSTTTLENAALEWRQQLGIPHDAIVFLYVGKLERKKAPEDLLFAFKQMGRNRNVHLIFAGSGAMESFLREHAEHNVHFIGFQNQGRMPIVYRMGNVVVLPSRGPGETWGLAINEAMACGRAVAASEQVGCAVDLIEPGVNGWRFPAADPEALGAVLKEAMAMGRADLQTMGFASYSMIQNWSMARQAETITHTLMTRKIE
ncbi:MAG: glycosyltransferase family 4 protein [Luteolibacter sp.]